MKTQLAATTRRIAPHFTVRSVTIVQDSDVAQMAAVPSQRKGLPRWADLFIASAILVLTAPLLLMAMLAVRLSSRGPM
ncbi:MAG: hypothetical protein ACRCZF_11705, partial [Gemmataceae bacterium]